MALLDAVPCVTDGISNCYANTIALNASKGIVSNVIITWDGVKWAQINDPTQILINDINSLVSELWTPDQAWAITGTPSVTGKAANGLYYDGCQGGQLSNDYSMRDPSGGGQAFNYCSSKGMRLPAHFESNGVNANGAPACYNSYTWTSTKYNFESYYDWALSGHNNGHDGYLNTYYVRCVR